MPDELIAQDTGPRALDPPQWPGPPPGRILPSAAGSS